MQRMLKLLCLKTIKEGLLVAGSILKVFQYTTKIDLETKTERKYIYHWII